MCTVDVKTECTQQSSLSGHNCVCVCVMCCVMGLGVVQADASQENLQLSDAKKVDADGLTRFIKMNNIRYITEYNQVVCTSLFLLLPLSPPF